ncbi:MAG: CinA family protein [Oligosphaeraceae bacterium]
MKPNTPSPWSSSPEPPENQGKTGGWPDRGLLPLVQQVAWELLRRQWHMATAESCTGGLVAAACTEVPGSSQWFDGGLVTYATAWKERLLQVPAETIRLHGVVSPQVVEAMLLGLERLHGVQAAVAVSGIAGPGGALPGKPVGTVALGAAAGPLRKTLLLHFPGDRTAVRLAAARQCLRLLLSLLETSPAP